MRLNVDRRGRRAGVLGVVVAAAAVLTSGCSVGGDIVSYELPPEPDRYTLEVETDGVTTVWEYTSERPTEDSSSPLQPCLSAAVGDPQRPGCRPEPLIFLRYDLGLDLDDTVPARRPHDITVTGYYQARLGEVPTVVGLTVEASFDGGRSWRQVLTRPAGEANTFTARIAHPPSATGAVALRVSAVDSDGNTVVQTIPEAYRLR